MNATIWCIIATLIAVAGAAAASSFGPFEDASGNDRDLTESGDIVEATGPFDKFGDGLDFENGHLERTDPVWSLDGGLSLTFAFSLEGDADILLLSYREGFETNWGIEWDSDAHEIHLLDTNFGGTFCEIQGVEPGDYSLYWWHNDRSLAADQNRMQLYDQDGLVGSCDEDANLQEDEGTLFVGDVRDGRANNGWELRTWGTNIDEATLAAIADPTNAEHAMEPEGTESALYFLQEVTLSEDPSPLNTVNVWTLDTDDDATKEILAQAMNHDGFPVESPGGIDLFITRTDGFSVEYYNLTTNEWGVTVASNPMDQRSTTLFNVTAPIEFSAESSVRLTATASFDTDPQNVDDVAFGDMEQQPVIPEPEASVLSDTAFHEFTGLTSLEWALLGLLAFLGVLVWSRSMDTVVRMFGAVLPLIAGALLLAFGADRGFGSVWNGLLAFSFVLLLSGVYMVIRLFLDAFLSPNQEAA